MYDTKPSYNLKVIVRETGIKADTLRAWERRYNLPVPERTAGGHRLYSQRDLETIKWLLARQEEGLSISHAVQLWRDLERNGRDPLQEMRVTAPILGVAPTTAMADLITLREAWIRACMNFDEVTAEQVLGQALARHAAEVVCLEVIQQGLAEIGRRWYENEATVQQEHFASAVALRRVDALLTAAPPPSRTQLICLACPPYEEHMFPLLLLALLLRYRGWPVAYFGANVPVAQMEEALKVTQPALVILTAQTLPAAAEMLIMARFLQDEQMRLAYGGRVFNLLPQIRQKVPGYFLGETLTEAVGQVAEILGGAEPMPTGQETPAAYRQAVTCFERQRPLLAWHVNQILAAEKWPEAYLQVANLHLAQNIRAALMFGDLDLVDPEITWVNHLLANTGRIPEAHLTHYLSVYYQVAQEHLEPDCRPVIEWLAGITAQSKLTS